MKLRKGQSKYKTPPVGQINCAWIEGNQRHNQICSMMLTALMPAKLPRTDELGMPMYFAHHGTTIEFYPKPDKPYVVKVRYTPPVKEF